MAPSGPALLGGRMAEGNRRAGLVMPLVPRIANDEHRPTGEPLPVLWRKWREQYGAHAWTKPGSIKNARRCEELTSVLPLYPSPGDVVTLLATLGTSMAPGTVALHRDILHGVYVFANAANLCRGNPVSRHVCPWKRPPPPEPHPIRNIREVWPELLRAFAADPPRVRAFLGVLRFTGVRVEEALGLYPADVQHRGKWHVSVARQRSSANSMETTSVKGKGMKATRNIPVRPPLRELLAPVLGEPPVQLRFGGRGHPRRDGTVPFLFPYRAHDLDKLRQRLGALFPEHFGERKAWHTFRHTLAYEMRADQKPTELIQSVLGHKSILTTEKYLSRLIGAQVDDRAFAGLDDEEGAPCPF